jgi:spoIIIJ-associated protein
MTEQLNKERMEKSAKTLATMFDYLGLNANVKANEVNGKIILAANSEDAGRIIGKKGQTLQSLELLINRIATKNDPECPWITINVDGYSSSQRREKLLHREGFERRKVKYGRQQEHRGHRREGFGRKNESSVDAEDAIQKMATDAAKEVKRWGEPVQLKPMNANDRRLVHMALKEDNEIKTESLPVEGSETLKSVIISLNQKLPKT